MNPKRLPAPADLAAALQQAALERLPTPEELARLTAPQRRRRVPVPVWRTGRRGGRQGL